MFFKLLQAKGGDLSPRIVRCDMRSLCASGERRIAVTERFRQTPLRVTERSLLARDRRHRERLGPGGEDGVIHARSACRPFASRNIGFVLPILRALNRVNGNAVLSYPGDLSDFPSLESPKHFSNAEPPHRQPPLSSPPSRHSSFTPSRLAASRRCHRRCRVTAA